MSRMFRLTEEEFADLLKKRQVGAAIKVQPKQQAPWVLESALQPPQPAPRAPKPAPTGPSQIHIRMRQQIQQAGLPEPIEEYYHIKGRDFRLDFAWPDRKIGVEVQGMAHRIKGKFHADIEKRALAMLQGWRILEVSGDTVRDERGIEWLKQLMRRPPNKE